MLVFRVVWKFRRRITEGSPKGRREGILAWLKPLARDNPLGRTQASGSGTKPWEWRAFNARTRNEGAGWGWRSRGNRDTQWKGWRGARKKKKKPPKEKKAPNKKRETAACGSACLRAAAPPSSLASFLSSFGGCAASFSCPLRASLSSCGRLRRPSSLLLLSRFFRAAAPPYPFRFSSSSPRFFGGCAASLSPALSWAAGAAPSPSSPTL